MTKDQISEIKTLLDSIDFAVEEIRGAQKTIQEARMDIYYILNSEKTGDELFKLSPEALTEPH